MEGQREKTSSRRRQRRKAKSARGKVVVEPVLIAARRPDSPLLKSGFRNIVASAQPKAPVASSGSAAPSSNGHGGASADELAESAMNGSVAMNGGMAMNGGASHGSAAANGSVANGSAATAAEDVAPDSEHALAGVNGGSNGGVAGVRRRAARIVRLADNVTAPSNREQLLIDRLVSSQGRGAISRAADDLWESKIAVPKRQEIQIQLLEHENETRARDAVFAMAELLQREAPIKRPVLDQRLRRLETSAEDPITRDAAGALRRSMRVHHGL